MNNASRAASAANQNTITRVNPYKFYAVRNFILNGSVERFTGDMKIIYQSLAVKQNRFGKIYINHARMDNDFGLAPSHELFSENSSVAITQKFLQMGILKKYTEENGRTFYQIIEEAQLELV